MKKEKEKVFGYKEGLIKENSDENYQVYHFKFEDDLKGLTIQTMSVISSVIPRIGETINISGSFVDNCLCFYNTDDDCGKEELDCFFPQKENEKESDYKHRLCDFINYHFCDAGVKEDESYNYLSTYIFEILEYTSFKIVKINRTFEKDEYQNDKSCQRVDIYLLGEFETEDFNWEE